MLLRLLLIPVTPPLNAARIFQGQENGELQLEDTLLLPADLSAEILSERFHPAWEALVDRGKPSLALAFRALFFRYVPVNTTAGLACKPDSFAWLACAVFFFAYCCLRKRFVDFCFASFVDVCGAT